MLDSRTIPFGRKDPDVDNSQADIGLTVCGSVPWKPTKAKDKRWDPINSKIIQVNL